MKRSNLLTKWPLALALSASLAGACSGDDSATENDPATAGIAEQLQSELDAAVPLNASTVSTARAVRPILKCVEKVSATAYKAHFGYQNTSSQSITIPISFFNRFWPNPANRGQQTTFAPGTQADVIQVSFNANSAVAWILGIHFDIASRYSRACPTTGGTGGAGTGGSGTGGRAGTGGAGTGGTGTGGAGTGGSGTGGHAGTGGAGTGGSGTGGHAGTGGAGTGGAGTGGRAGTGGAGTGGAGTGGSGTGGAGTGGSGTGGAGQCPSTCDDRNPCTVDTCSALTGFQCSNIPGPDGMACSDGNACTIGDVCMAGVCTMGTPRICSATDQCHAAGVCDTTTGACSNPTAPNGATCNDNNACTGASSCQAGVCIGTQPTVCQPSDQCHIAGTCDPASGTCSNPTAANGTTCSDNNACTTGDSCQSGACSPGTPRTCTSAGQCRGVGICDPTSGVCSNPAAPNGTACDDANLCTTGESCVAGACSGGVVKTCASTGVCHAAGVCQPATGTCTDPIATDGTTCDDGNACSTGDACRAGVCTATTTLGADECVSSDCAQCTNDNCVPFTINGCSLITDLGDKALCQAAYACFRDNAAACVSSGDPLKCWCGTNQITCNTSNTPPTQANGVCLAQVMAAAKSTDASTIKLRFVDPNFPLGRAVNMTLCRGSFCSAGSAPDGISSACPPF